ncbi:MAG: hypothetical protein IPP56_12595 [Bacteroidetes bacterium]|nr:hypothetical protein [Bacteroidota bacterium]MBK9671616.1 hypothetical protein [Bacteroidota bacterium]MBK9800505.1 hypothetical protein [Bacteroidota bacterium]MBP6412750.1 hypothetical protein [Bacteroidia bacterium]
MCCTWIFKLADCVSLTDFWLNKIININSSVNSIQNKKRIFQNDSEVSEDYYLNENGFIVFTESYHLKRGYCCNNSCKHCPYNVDSSATNSKK